MTETLTKAIVCCAEHDHATAPDCLVGAKEIVIPLTAEEISQREAAATAAAERKAEEDAAAEAAAQAKASAEAKLAALGLTPEEIAAL